MRFRWEQIERERYFLCVCFLSVGEWVLIQDNNSGEVDGGISSIASPTNRPEPIRVAVVNIANIFSLRGSSSICHVWVFGGEGERQEEEFLSGGRGKSGDSIDGRRWSLDYNDVDEEAEEPPPPP